MTQSPKKPPNRDFPAEDNADTSITSQNTTGNQLPNFPQKGEHRTVSKRACLACREKKIKCDGEVHIQSASDASATEPSSSSSNPPSVVYKKCTNCISAGIECIFVPSRRGGRRKKALISGEPFHGSKPSVIAPAPLDQQHPLSGPIPLSLHIHGLGMLPGQQPQQQQQHMPGPVPGTVLAPPQILPPSVMPPSVMPPSLSGGMTMVLPSIVEDSGHADTNSSVSASFCSDGAASNAVANAAATSAACGFQTLPPPTTMTAGSVHSVQSVPSVHSIGRTDAVPGRAQISAPSSVAGAPIMPMSMQPQVARVLAQPSLVPPPQAQTAPGMAAYYQQPQQLQQPQKPQPYAECMLPILPVPGHRPQSVIVPQSRVPSYFTGSPSSINVVPADASTGNYANGKYSEAPYVPTPTSAHSAHGTSHNLATQQNVPDNHVQKHSSLSASPDEHDKKRRRGPSHPGSVDLAADPAAKLLSDKHIKPETVATSMTPSPYGSYYKQLSPQAMSQSISTDGTTPVCVSLSGGEVQMPIYLTEKGLRKVGLPRFRTVCYLVDLYYRYCNSSYMILPNRDMFIGSLSTSPQKIAQLSAIFRFSCAFLSPSHAGDPKFLSAEYWGTQVARYREYLAGSEQTVVETISCCRGDDDQLLRTSRTIKFFAYVHVFNNKNLSEMEAYRRISTPLQIVEREMFVRTLWDVYQFQVFRRYALGPPYKTARLLDFPGEVELPMPNNSYYSQKEASAFKKDYKNFVKFSDLDLDDPEDSPVYTSSSVALASRFLEMAIDYISEGKGGDDLPKLLGRRIYKHKQLAVLSPYKVEGSNIVLQQHIVLFSIIVDLASLVLHCHAAPKFILWPLPGSQVGNFLANVELFDPKPGEKQKGTQDVPRNGTPKEFESFLGAVAAACDLEFIIELGEGVCPEGKFPVTVEPATLPVSEFTNVPMANETWYRYPQITVGVVSHAISVLCSFVAALKVYKFETLSHHMVKVVERDTAKEFCTVSVAGDMPEPLLENMLKETIDTDKLAALCFGKVNNLHRYMTAWGRYFKDVDFASRQVADLVVFLKSSM